MGEPPKEIGFSPHFDQFLLVSAGDRRIPTAMSPMGFPILHFLIKLQRRLGNGKLLAAMVRKGLETLVGNHSLHPNGFFPS